MTTLNLNDFRKRFFVRTRLKPNLTEWLLILAVLIYGFGSYPWPRTFGISEIFIGILLVLTIGYFFILIILEIIRDQKRPIKSVYVFLYFFTIPTLTGLNRWDFKDLIRDFIPFLYLFIPIAFYKFYSSHSKETFVIKLFPYVYSLAGISFAYRSFEIIGLGIGDVGKLFPIIDLNYFSYDPMVIFSVIFLFLTSIYLSATAKLGIFNILTVSLMVLVSLLGAGSLIGVVQRAPLGLLALSWVFFVFRLFKNSIRQGFVGIMIGAILFLFLNYQSEGLLSLIINKTRATGVNGKFDEFKSIISELLRSSIFTKCFGFGWGATYNNPILNGERVRFSHSILSFYLLKTGFIGFALLWVYLGWLIKMYFNCLKIAWEKRVEILPLVFAIGITVVIGLLQVTYKTLSYGLIMALIPLLYLHLGKLEKIQR